MSPTDPHDLVHRFVAAEIAHDVSALDSLLADDFRGVGPLGFVLDRDQWLRRFADGLVYRSLDVLDVQVRTPGDAVSLAIGVWDQVAEYREHANAGRFRVGLTMHRPHDGWVLWGVQLSGPMPEAVR